MDVYNAALEEFCAQRDIPYVPLADHLTGGTEIFSDLVHLNLVGIERKAEVLHLLLEDPILELMHKTMKSAMASARRTAAGGLDGA